MQLLITASISSKCRYGQSVCYYKSMLFINCKYLKEERMLLVALVLINNSMNGLNYTTTPFAHAALYINLFAGAGVSAHCLPIANVLRLMSDSHAY